MVRLLLAGLLATILFQGISFADDIFATTADGRRVLLRDDGTYHFVGSYGSGVVKSYGSSSSSSSYSEECSVISAAQKGESDSRDGKSSSDALEMFRRCPQSLQSDLVQSYRQAYTETQQQILVARQNKLLDEAERGARDKRIRASKSSFIYNDAQYLTTCEILSREVKIIASPQGKVKATPKKWRVDFFDDEGNLLGSENVKSEVYFKGKHSEEFTLYVGTIRDDAKICKVALRD